MPPIRLCFARGSASRQSDRSSERQSLTKDAPVTFPLTNASEQPGMQHTATPPPPVPAHLRTMLRSAGADTQFARARAPSSCDAKPKLSQPHSECLSEPCEEITAALAAASHCRSPARVRERFPAMPISKRREKWKRKLERCGTGSRRTELRRPASAELVVNPAGPSGFAEPWVNCLSGLSSRRNCQRAVGASALLGLHSGLAKAPDIGAVAARDFASP